MKKQEKIQELEKEIQKPDFWQNQEKAAEISQELADLKEEKEKFEKLKENLEELKEIIKLSDETLEKEIEERIFQFEKEIKKEEEKTFLSGKYDKGNTVLSIYSGAGGQDAQDWATMLLRMYERYCAGKEFKTKILHQSFGEGGGPEGRIGTKSATLEIKGKYAFGFLKKETGVHRLVRISPFSPQKLRHTSFALIEVLPEISRIDEKEIKISPDDLRIDAFRASGPGGQYVNRRESAIRITHLPTNIVVSCQGERLQGLNKEKAMKLLYAKLYQMKEKERQKEIKEVKGKSVSAEWGNQIRSYVLHPYKMVKDLRTSIETSNVEAVLDGNLDKFIEAEIKS
ncbi:peptide chain release factor 2 [Candidatus Parcubacteria bacterium]|nr:peptide chain release factor 2 [Candidatus Parcubacteria bacterium]